MLKLTLSVIGQIKPGPEKDLIETYRMRAAPLARQLGFVGFEIFEHPAPQRGTYFERQNQESALLLSSARPGETLFVLDEKGKAQGSVAFATLLAALRDQGCPGAVFMIGGADGHSEDMKARAKTSGNHLLSLGPATWPHMLARVMLAEQLYRALTILGNHPYHRR